LDVLESFEEEAKALASFEPLDADLVKSEN
jgi:hypothetical protein